jgi:hypothetical protein
LGKIVYVPAAAYLALRALRADASLLVYPVTFLIVAFLLLDIVPQSIVRPYTSGQTMHNGAVLFAYILGAALFGWYGLFCGPLLLVLVVQFANVVLGDLLRGTPFSPTPSDALGLGTDPANASVGAVDETTGEGAHDGTASGGTTKGGTVTDGTDPPTEAEGTGTDSDGTASGDGATNTD